MLKHYIVSSLRSIKKNRLYSFLSIGGFAIGFAAFILISAYIYREFSTDSQYPNSKRIYRIVDDEKNDCLIDYKLQSVLLSKYPEIEESCPLGLLEGWEVDIVSEKKSNRTSKLGSTTNDFFDMFSISVLEKTGKLPFSEITSAAITKSVAQKLFPNKSPLGEIINVANYVEAKITAVIDDFPASSSFRPELLLNSENEKFRFGESCNGNDCYNPVAHFLLLKEETDVNEFENKLNSSLGKYQSRINNVWLQNLTDIYMAQQIKGNYHESGNKNSVLIFLIISLVIVAITVLNYLNYSFAMQFSYIKDLGVRKVNGAKNKHIRQYYLIQVLLNITISLVISIILIVTFLPFLNTLFNKPIGFSDFLQMRYVVFVFLVIVPTIFVCTLVPLGFISGKNVREWLNGKLSRFYSGEKAYIFSIVQFTASIVLIIAVLMVQKQLNFIRFKDLGFNKDHLLRIELPYGFDKIEAVKQKLSQLYFVKGVVESNGTPGRINQTMGNGSNENYVKLNIIVTENNFLDVFKMQLKEGHLPKNEDYGKVCLYNETAVKASKWDTYEGNYFKNGKAGNYEVIGVISDFNVASVHEKIAPTAIIFEKSDFYSALNARLSPGDIKFMMDKLKEAWESIAPEHNFNYTFYDMIFDNMYQQEKRLAKTISLFSIIALLLTCLGVLGLIYQKCLFKTKEIGIRKVNGAKITDVMLHLNKGLVKWVFIAYIMAVPIGWYAMNKWLENFAYKTEMNWWVFVLAGFTALLIALLTVSWQTWRTARRNPVEALRYE